MNAQKTLTKMLESGESVDKFVKPEDIAGFPEDKLIYLMCGGGGYAWMTKQILIKLGYSMDFLAPFVLAIIIHSKS